jgi:hypothetical protein
MTKNTTPLTAHIGYAYTPRQGAISASSNHAVLDQPLRVGRLVRDQSDALCRPRRKFWGLESASTEREVTCPRCTDLAARHGVVIRHLPEETDRG